MVGKSHFIQQTIAFLCVRDSVILKQTEVSTLKFPPTSLPNSPNEWGNTTMSLVRIDKSWCIIKCPFFRVRFYLSMDANLYLSDRDPFL